MKYLVFILFLFAISANAQECGDSIVEEPEECDDGNAISTDDCIDCVIASCGDNFVWVLHEQCDDGNENNFDDCRDDCTLPYCGDAIVDSGEGCDDGGTTDWDGCKADCSATESDENVVMYRELQGLESQRAQLLHTQKEFSTSAVNERHDFANAAIARWSTLMTEAQVAGNNKVADSIQDRINRLVELRDRYDSTDIGSPRDIASKLDPSDLTQSIVQLEKQLGIQ